jgi:signal transduction histidine kinase
MSVRSRRLLLYVVTPALLAAITWADYATGYELGFFVFYFAPVALASWYGGRRAGLAYAVAAGACWYLSDRLSNTPYSNALLIYWETFMRLVSFLTTALTLSQIRSDLRKREELLDVISHDLRAPLGALTWQAQLLAKRTADGFAAARTEAILRCASRMNTMIEDLVDSARKESRQLQPTIQRVRVGSYLAEMIERFDHVLDVRRIRLRLEPGNPLLARADPARLERIVLNLLMNAQKYSPEESLVEVEAHGSNGWVTIRVADRGPGIPPSDLPHLFEKFYRGRQAAAGGGLGIGLYSVRLLVEAFGGRVRAEAGAAGGTAFVVTLPGEAASAV